MKSDWLKVFLCDTRADLFQGLKVVKGAFIFWIVLLANVSAEDVTIRKVVTVPELSSGQEVLVGTFELSRLAATASDFRIGANFDGKGREAVFNPAPEDFDFQFWFDSEVTVIGRKDGEALFEFTSGQDQVVNEFLSVSGGETMIYGFEDVRAIDEVIADVGAFAGGEIEIFFRVEQSLIGGTTDLSTLMGYRDVSMEINLDFSSDLEPIPASNLTLEVDFRKKDEGELSFISRLGFEYTLIRPNSQGELEVLVNVVGTGTDLRFDIADFEIEEPAAIFLLKEAKIDPPGDGK